MSRFSEALAALHWDGPDLDPDELLSDAVLIARVTRLGDGRSSTAFARSTGTDVVSVTGLIECARQINAATADWTTVEDDDDP